MKTTTIVKVVTVASVNVNGEAYKVEMELKYMGATEIMLQSEGEYNKRQIRLKMYTRVGK